MRMNRRQLLATTAASMALATLGTGPAAAQDGAVNQPYGLPIAAEFPFTKMRVAVLESEMAFVQTGAGPTVLFLHGNPTSSYLWRNVIPHVATGYRVIAPDLIGMGDSGKPDIGYTFTDHAAYLDAFIDSMGLMDLTIVGHDWGAVLGMRYARLNPDNVRAIAFMEAMIPPRMPLPSYEAMGDAGDLFRNLRTEGVGEEMVLQNNFFVEEILAKMGVIRGLTEAEMEHYRAPYPTPESRRPTLQWPRELPIDGQPKAAYDAVVANGSWLTQSALPKLFFYASRGAMDPASMVEFEWVIANVPNIETRFVGPGIHFLQEEHPDLIGTGIADWLRRLNQTS